MAMRIFMTNGTGLVGRSVLRSLIRLGCGVRTLVPPGAGRGLPRHHKLQIVQRDPDQSDGWLGDIRHFDVVIHMLEAKDASLGTSEDVRVTHRILQAAGRPGSRVKRMVLLSKLGASSESPHPQLRAAWESEELVRASDMEHLILRPGPIWIQQAPLGTVARWTVRLLGRIPVVGQPGQRIQPVALTNVVEGLVKAVRIPLARSNTYSVAGPRVYQLDQWMEIVARQLGNPSLKAWYVSQDSGLARWSGLSRRIVPPYLTGQVCNPIDFYKDLCIRPIRIDDATGSPAQTLAESKTGPTFR